MARTPVLAAGGIVMRREQPPLIGVVRVRKRDEWVLPKGKLDDGETPRAAARREVLEETGHDVTVHEFLGTLVYDSGGRAKVVHYWRMEAGAIQVRELTSDVRAVDWLPLDAAIERLSRGYERTFLENVGPLAVSALSRRAKKANAPSARRKRVALPQAAPPASLPEMPDQPALPPEAPIEAPTQPVAEAPQLQADADVVPPGDAVESIEPAAATDDAAAAPGGQPAIEPERKSLAQKVRDWLGRAA